MAGLRLPFPPQQGGQDGVGREQRAAEVGVVGAVGILGPARVRLAGDAQQPGHSHVVDLVPGQVGVGPAAPVAREGAVDDGRVDPGHGLEIHPQAGGDPGAEALHQYVAAGGQAQEDIPPPGGLEVQADQLLLDVEILESSRGHDPHVVAAPGVLHLEHLGAQGGQQHGAIGAGQQGGQVQDLDVL